MVGILGWTLGVFAEPVKGSVEEVAGKQDAGHEDQQQTQVEARAVELDWQGVGVFVALQAHGISGERTA